MTSVADVHGRYISQVMDFKKVIVIITNVYGYNIKGGNEDLFDNIQQQLIQCLDKFPNAFLLLGGDFTVALDNLLDRWPPRPNIMLTCLISSCKDLIW